MPGDFKINNDILIPRSILKKCDRRVFKNLFEEQFAPDEAIYGTHIKRNNPLLSPKFN